jgi:hypothetical protein
LFRLLAFSRRTITQSDNWTAALYDLPEQTNGLQKAQHDSYNLADAVVTRIKNSRKQPAQVAAG